MNARSAKSSSISCATHRDRKGRHGGLPLRLVVLLVVVLLVAMPAAAAKKKKKPTEPEDLFNPLLGLEYSHWLVGPIADIASVDEVHDYLALVSDADAETFIESFWARRAEGLGFFDKKPRQIFEERAAEADKKFSEGAIPGRRTDRGKVWILYGEPEEISFEAPREVHVPTLEHWTYPKDAEEGLDGEKPRRLFRFVQVDNSTVFYTNQKIRRIDRGFPDSRRRIDGSGGF